MELKIILNMMLIMTVLIQETTPVIPEFNLYSHEKLDKILATLDYFDNEKEFIIHNYNSAEESIPIELKNEKIANIVLSYNSNQYFNNNIVKNLFYTSF
jgi:hypothetical protein